MKHTILFWIAIVVFVVVYAAKNRVDTRQKEEPSRVPAIEVPVSPGLPSEITQLYQLPPSVVCWYHTKYKSIGPFCSQEISNAKRQD